MVYYTNYEPFLLHVLRNDVVLCVKLKGWILCVHRTLPAGYLEVGESAAEGAMRETWEEAGATVEVISPFAQLDIPLIGQVHILKHLCFSFLSSSSHHCAYVCLLCFFFGSRRMLFS